MKKLINLLTASALVTLSSIAFAQTDVPNTFEANTPAASSEVNANFDALATAIDALASRVTALENASPGDGQDTVTGNVDGRTYRAFQVDREIVAAEDGVVVEDVLFTNDLMLTFGAGGMVEIQGSTTDGVIVSNGSIFIETESDNPPATYLQTGQSVVITVVDDDGTDSFEFIFSPDGTSFISLLSGGSDTEIIGGLIVGVETVPTGVIPQ